MLWHGSSWLKDQGSGIVAHWSSFNEQWAFIAGAAKKRPHPNSSHDASAPSLRQSAANKDSQDVGFAEESDQQHLARHGNLHKTCARCRLASQLVCQ